MKIPDSSKSLRHTRNTGCNADSAEVWINVFNGSKMRNVEILGIVIGIFAL